MHVAKVELVVLGLLADEPLYGYQVLRRLRDRSMGFWVEVGRASVYQVLDRLEARGLVTGRAQGAEDGPDRRVFRLTRAGTAQASARAWTSASASSRPTRPQAGTGLGLVHLLSAGDARGAVDAREAGVRDLLDAVSAERTRVGADRGPARAVANAMLDRQEALAKAELVWLKGFRQQLGKIRR